DIVICPPYLSMVVLDGLLRDSHVELGAQNVSHFKNGAHTGEISAEMLKQHCSYVIIGHSERRRQFGETNEMVNEKVLRAIEAELQPIVCISNEEELAALAGIKAKQKNWIVAFEPIEAIGTGEPSDPETVAQMVKKIRKQLGSVVVLYGGSVDETNIKKYLQVSDGALIGGASLDPNSFLEICRVVNN